MSFLMNIITISVIITTLTLNLHMLDGLDKIWMLALILVILHAKHFFSQLHDNRFSHIIWYVGHVWYIDQIDWSLADGNYAENYYVSARVYIEIVISVMMSTFPCLCGQIRFVLEDSFGMDTRPLIKPNLCWIIFTMISIFFYFFVKDWKQMIPYTW